MRIIEELFNIVAPHECVGCGAEGALLCGQCSGGLASLPPRCYRCQRWSDDFLTCQPCRRQTPLSSVWTVTTYNGAAKEVIRRLKFERARAGAETIAEMLAHAYTGTDDVLVTYVPTANVRVRQRGYDQAALIAKALARRLQRPCLPLLARIGSQRQLGQLRQTRKQQMLHAFRPINLSATQNKHILLVDDVLTTGATCEAAASVLKQAGAKRVSAIVFAVA